MPKYVVTVRITNTPRDKEIRVYAKDEAEAEEKACDIVLGWEGVEDAESIDVDVDD